MAHYACLCSALLTFIAVLVATFSYISRQEFLQEIYRRKDIHVTGDGCEVQMALNSYLHLRHQIKIHRQEINKKEMIIKTLEKEKLMKEVICAELKISLKEAEEKLLQSNKTISKEVEWKKRNNIISTEKSEDLLSIGLSSYRKVSDKLNRKRSVEENNLQSNDEVSQHFKQNFKNLEENLNLFIDTSTKFITDMRDKIDGNLQKHYTKITETSEIFEDLEDILSNILEEHDERFYDQAYNTEKTMKEFLNLARLNSDSAVKILHSYIAEIFLPMCQSVHRSLIQHRNEMEFFHYQFRTQVQNQQDSVSAFLRIHTESIKQLQKKIELFVQKSNKTIENIQKNTHSSIVMQRYLGEKFKSKIDEMKSALHKAEEIYHDSMFSLSKHQHEVINSLKPVFQANQRTLHEFAVTVDHEERKTFDFISMLNKQADNCYSTLSESSSKLSILLKETDNFRNQLEHSTRGAVVSVVDIWKEHYNVMDKYIHKFSQSMQLKLQIQYEKRQGMEEKCNILEKRLKEEFEKYIINEEIFVQEQIGNLNNHKTFLSHWKNVFITDLQTLDINNVLYQYINHDIIVGGKQNN